MSKHSMRKRVRSSTARSSASTSARVRACCEPSSASSRASAISAPLMHISSQTRRCSRGWCWTRHAHAALRRQRLDQRLVDGVADDQQRRHAAVEVVLGDEGLEHLHLDDGAAARRRRRPRRASRAAPRSRPRHASGSTARSPRWRPPRTIARLTQARPPCTLTARMSTSLVARRCCPRPTAGAARATARRSGCAARPPARTRSASACAIICACSASITLLLLAAQEALGVGDVARVVLGRDVVRRTGPSSA